MSEKVMLCAGSEGKDSCTGDLGGPLIDSDGRLVGITSWGAGCGKNEFPGVYTRITGVNKWLKRHICSVSDYPPDWCEAKGLNK
jgi:trypsin